MYQASNQALLNQIAAAVTQMENTADSTMCPQLITFEHLQGFFYGFACGLSFTDPNHDRRGVGNSSFWQRHRCRQLGSILTY